MSSEPVWVADVADDGATSQGRCTCGWRGKEHKPGTEWPYVDVDLHHCDTGHRAASRPSTNLT